MQYRRAWIEGGTYFFTVNLADRSSSLLVERIDTLRAVTARVMQLHPFTINAIAVMPEHLHAIWTLPPNDAKYDVRWMLIKALFSKQIPPGEQRSASRRDKGERGIWQRRYWEHLIRDERDYEKHVDYIHYNPVKHRHVGCAAEWPYSSIHRYIAEGMMPRDWGGQPDKDKVSPYGEREPAC